MARDHDGRTTAVRSNPGACVIRPMQVAVLQPFLRQAAARRRPTRTTLGQSFPSPSVSFRDACHKLNEAVALVDSLGCEVVLKEVSILFTRKLARVRYITKLIMFRHLSIGLS